MNEEDAKQFAEDLESGAFFRGLDRQHRITLDIRNMVKGRGPRFSKYWDSYE